MNPNVTVIILNWNRWKDTIECLASVVQNGYSNYTVIIVDNASTDDSLAKIDAYCKNELKAAPHFSNRLIRNRSTLIANYTLIDADAPACRSNDVSYLGTELVIIQNDQNYGFAEGNNIAIAYALEVLNPDYVLLLNNDTVVDKCFLTELVVAAEADDDIGLTQPKILRYVDSRIDNTGILCDVLGNTTRRGLCEKDRGQYDRDMEAGFFYASGACLLIKKSLLSALGGECFDLMFFAYHEDVDLSWMARLLNYKILFCPTSLCHHKGGATSGGHNPQTAYLIYRNRMRVLIKNYSFAVLAAALPVFILIKLLLLSSGAVLNMRPDYLTSFLRAVGWNVQNIRSTIDRRRFIQSRRELSDKEVMKYMVRHSLDVESALKALRQGEALS
jgi:GT2 family glycosyltransferase